MDKRKICEAMYALPGGVVIRRRKPLLVPALLIAAGVAAIVWQMNFGAAFSADVRSAVVFVGGSLALGGMIALAARMFGSEGAPFHRAGRCYLRYEELYFDRALRDEVVQCVDKGDVEALLARPRAQVPALAVALYRTRDNRFAALQAFEYAELEYRPLSRLKIVTGQKE